MSKERARQRLVDPEGRALAELARLVVHETTATPMKDIATPSWITSQITAALEAATQGDLLRSWVDRRIASERERWSQESRTLRTWLPPEAERPLREVLGREYVPDEELTFRLIDHAAVRNLVRTVLTSSLRRFARRFKTPDGGRGAAVFGGLRDQARQRSRKLFGGMADNLGGLAENLVGAVKDEIDGVMEGRVTEFAGKATTEAIRYIARYIADPAHAAGFGEFRIALLDVILDTPIQVLAGEAEKLEPEELVDVVQVAIRSALANEDFVQETQARVTSALDEAGDGTLGAWLAEIGLLEIWTESTTELVAQRLQAVVKTPGFDAWWDALFAE